MATLLCAAFATGVRADSDGYYCTSSGYLAYQLRSALTPGVVGSHVVRVVRFSEAGISVAEVVLPDFQPHKMVCIEGELTIGGWMGRPVEYVIDVTGAPKIVREISDPGRALQSSALRNLGSWATAGTTALASSGKGFAYRLVITTREQSVQGGLRHHTRSVVEQVDAQGAVVNTVTLFEGSRLETIH